MEIAEIHSAWRDSLRPASFRGAGFFVEVGARAGGRRNVEHEYPKRDTPYAEDMGRRARSFVVTGYLIGPDYVSQRDQLEAALDAEGAGTLILPTRSSQQVVCPGFSTMERRTLGGYCEVEMNFAEAGVQGNSTTTVSTASGVRTAATAADDAALASMSAGLA